MLQNRRHIALLTIAALTLFAFIETTAGASSHHTVARTVLIGDLTRTYYLYVSPNLPMDRPVSLVLMFHGTRVIALIVDPDVYKIELNESIAKTRG